MTTFTKHSDQPLIYHFNFQESLDATYQLASILFTPSVLTNSAGITLNLEKTSDTPSVFNHSFFQTFDGFDGENNITITISTAYANGHITTHQELGTHIERPILKNRLQSK